MQGRKRTSDRSFGVLKAVYSIPGNTVQAHILENIKGCWLWVHSRAENSSAIGLGHTANSPATRATWPSRYYSYWRSHCYKKKHVEYADPTHMSKAMPSAVANFIPLFPPHYWALAETECSTWVIRGPCVQSFLSWAVSVTNNHENMKWKLHPRRSMSKSTVHKQSAWAGSSDLVSSTTAAPAPTPHLTAMAVWGILYAQITRRGKWKYVSFVRGHNSKTVITYKTASLRGGLEDQQKRKKPPNWGVCLMYIVWKREMAQEQ